MLKGIKTHYVHIYRTWDMTIFGLEFEPKLQVFVYLLSGSLTGGSGGGHGGSGGRGAGIYTVGQGYDSLYTPVQYGSPGGYGTLRGMC